MTIVVKVGGAVGNAAGPLVEELAGRTDWVLVHGGSDAVDRLGDALGVPSRYYTSPSGVVSRRSDPAHLDVLTLALAGRVNPSLVAAFVARGVKAVGLSGIDGPLLVGRRKEGAREVVGGKILRVTDDYAGTVERVDGTLLRLLLDRGYAPIVHPPAVTSAGEVINVDADRAAAAVATAVRAEALVLLTNVPGLLRDVADPSSLIARVAPEEIEAVLPLAQGRMRKKILAAQAALAGGVGRVVVAPSGRNSPVAAALRGEGTVIG